jgi:hypothetical protein
MGPNNTASECRSFPPKYIFSLLLGSNLSCKFKPSIVERITSDLRHTIAALNTFSLKDWTISDNAVREIIE